MNDKQNALHQLLEEYDATTLLDMIQTLGDAYLECCEGAPDMQLIHQQRSLERYLRTIERQQLQLSRLDSNRSIRAV